MTLYDLLWKATNGTECGHEFDTYDYDNVMIEDMKYCPFCGRKIRKVVYEGY